MTAEKRSDELLWSAGNLLGASVGDIATVH